MDTSNLTTSSELVSETTTAAAVNRRSMLRRLGGAGLLGAAMVTGTIPGANADEISSTSSDAGEAPGTVEELVVPPASAGEMSESRPELAGRIRRRLDDNRGIWLDTGEGWTDTGGYVFDVRAFGATGDGQTDDWSAFQAAIEAMQSPLQEESTTPFGRTLFVPPGRYRLAQTLVLSRSVRMVGAGAGQFGDAILAPDPGLIGVIIDAGDPLQRGAAGRSGEGAILERLRIESAGQRGDPRNETGTTAESTSAINAHGVWLRTRATLRDCAITGFAGNGIQVGSQPTENQTVEATGANGWAIHNCHVASCGGDGLAVQAASAGLCMLLESDGNAGWGLQDSSSFGNTYLQCHVAENAKGPFRTSGAGNRSLILGCISEPGQQPGSFVQGTFVIGGRHGATYQGGNGWTANGARALFIAQEPVASEGGPAMAPTVQIQGVAGQQAPHLLITGNDNAHQLAVHPDGQVIVGDIAPASGDGQSKDGRSILMQISGGPEGATGIRWSVLGGETGFTGWVAQARAFHDGGGPDAPGSRASFEGGRFTIQTPNATGAELDTLTLRGGRVGIGTTAPAAPLDIASTTSGALLPRMTGEQRNAIKNPPEASLIYNLTTKHLNLFDGKDWQEIGFTVTGG